MFFLFHIAILQSYFFNSAVHEMTKRAEAIRYLLKHIYIETSRTDFYKLFEDIIFFRTSCCNMSLMLSP